MKNQSIEIRHLGVMALILAAALLAYVTVCCVFAFDLGNDTIVCTFGD